MKEETLKVGIMDNILSDGTEERVMKGPKEEKSEQDLKSLGQYNREVSKELLKETFKREPLRLKYGLLFSSIIGMIIYLNLTMDLAWFVKLVLSIFMGICLGGNTFLCHELLHGAIVKNRKLQTVLSFVGLAPFLISPTYWRFWHNTLHHGNTQLLYKDPDAFPTMTVWKRSKFMQFVFPLCPGSRYLRSYFYFFYWFSFQAVLNQVYMRFRNKMWSKMNHKQVTFEFALVCLLAIGYMGAIGVEHWLWLLFIPFFVLNYTVMSYISTNHNISPYTKINDPLLNSLSVTNHPVMEFFNLNFGYHTEHHLFPSMPASQSKKVSEKLKQMYPDRYKIMPKWRAMKLLYSTPRIYKNRDLLIHPETKKEYATLGRESMLQ